jgi:peptidoglycan lytic transglycosylase
VALYQRGSQGPEVAKIQTRLQELGLYAGPLDGKTGNGTWNALRQVQDQAGSPAMGDLDDATLTTPQAP